MGVRTSLFRMVKIFRKEDWELTSNDKQLNAILGMIEQNGGECPCYNESRDGTSIALVQIIWRMTYVIVDCIGE